MEGVRRARRLPTPSFLFLSRAILFITMTILFHVERNNLDTQCMKRKFFLHRQNEPMQADTVVYQIWCGESVREQRKLAALMSWAFQTGATLRQWSENIDYYLMLESERVFPAHGLLNFGFVSVSQSIADALAHAKADDWDIFENNLPTEKSYFHMCQVLDRPSVNVAAGEIHHSHVLTEPRKYLSESIQDDWSIIRFK